MTGLGIVARKKPASVIVKRENMELELLRREVEREAGCPCRSRKEGEVPEQKSVNINNNPRSRATSQWDGSEW